MSFTAQDVQQKIQELSAEGAPFAPCDFNVDGVALKGYANAPSDRLAAYKVPNNIEIVTQPLPHNASGKLFKRQIQDSFVAGLQA